MDITAAIVIAVKTTAIETEYPGLHKTFARYAFMPALGSIFFPIAMNGEVILSVALIFSIYFVWGMIAVYNWAKANIVTEENDKV